MIDKPLINRVANSGIITIDLEEYFPKREIVDFDLKGWLFKEMILKEKDFRAALKEHDWSQYQDKVVTMFCSVDAIIPTWAYMLVSSYCHDIAIDIFQGNKDTKIVCPFQHFCLQYNSSLYMQNSCSEVSSLICEKQKLWGL